VEKKLYGGAGRGYGGGGRICQKVVISPVNNPFGKEKAQSEDPVGALKDPNA